MYQIYRDCYVPNICWCGLITNSCIHMASLGRMFFTRKASKWPGLNTFTHGCRMTLAEASEGCQFVRALAILWRMGAYRGSSLSFIRGSHGCSQEWIGMVSVSGFQFSTSCSNRGNTSWSKMFSMIHEGRTGSHVSNTSIRGWQARTFHFLQKNNKMSSDNKVKTLIISTNTKLGQIIKWTLQLHNLQVHV